MCPTIKKQTGFALVEILAMIFVLTAMGFLFNGLFRTLLQEMPASIKVLDADTALGTMLQVLRADIDKAKSIQTAGDANMPATNFLLLQSPDKLVRYSFVKNKITRDIADANNPSNFKSQSFWQPSWAVVSWRTGELKNVSYLEISTAIEHKYNGRIRRKLANSHIFFAGAMPLPGESK